MRRRTSATVDVFGERGELWNGLLIEEFVNVLPERNVWSRAVHTYCSFSGRKTKRKRKNKFYPKSNIFLHCIEN